MAFRAHLLHCCELWPILLQKAFGARSRIAYSSRPAEDLRDAGDLQGSIGRADLRIVKRRGSGAASVCRQLVGNWMRTRAMRSIIRAPTLIRRSRIVANSALTALEMRSPSPETRVNGYCRELRTEGRGTRTRERRGRASSMTSAGRLNFTSRDRNVSARSAPEPCCARAPHSPGCRAEGARSYGVRANPSRLNRRLLSPRSR